MFQIRFSDETRTEKNFYCLEQTNKPMFSTICLDSSEIRHCQVFV